MIAFGCVVSEVEHYERYAEPGIRRAAEPDSIVLARATPRSVAPIYNLILDEAAALDGLEALVLLSERAEILDPRFCQKIRKALAQPEVAIVGCAGAADVRSIAWWEGTDARASTVYRSEQLGGEFPGLLPDGRNDEARVPRFEPGEVDVVDGVVFVLSPWAVENIRFDEALGPRYGFDFDFCLQVRAAGRKVAVADLQVAHHYPLGVVEDAETWMEAHMRAAEKWDGRIPGHRLTQEDQGRDASTEDRGRDAPREDWKRRARRAEAEAAAARLLAASKMYQSQALIRAQEREFEQATSNLSWKITAPLRRGNFLRRRLAERRP
jgi:hypothetical protein